MATEQASTIIGEPSSLAKRASWLAAVVGLWVLVSPFVLDGSIASATAMWSNVVAGVVALILAGSAGYVLHSGG